MASLAQTLGDALPVPHGLTPYIVKSCQQPTGHPSLEVAPTILATFSSCDREPRNFKLKLDIDSVNMNQHAKYLGQKTHFISKFIVRAHRQTQTDKHVWTTSSSAWVNHRSRDVVTAVDCGQPERAVDADMSSLTSSTYGNSVTFRCFSGLWFYRDAFTLTSTCQANGQWSELERKACTRKRRVRFAVKSFDCASISRQVCDLFSSPVVRASDLRLSGREFDRGRCTIGWLVLG